METQLRRIFIYFGFLLISVWLVASFIRTFYNVSKIFTEEIAWIILSDEQRREKLFGDLHNLFRFVEKQTPEGSNIIFLAPGGKAYFLGRYYLYPRKLKWVKSPKSVDSILSLGGYNYILMYQAIDPDLDEYKSNLWKLRSYTPIATYSGELKTMSKATIYKL